IQPEKITTWVTKSPLFAMVQSHNTSSPREEPQVCERLGDVVVQDILLTSG
ncbi:hypothetical protein Tco_0602172, partial [Tanacetum coccineum]